VSEGNAAASWQPAGPGPVPPAGGYHPQPSQGPEDQAQGGQAQADQAQGGQAQGGQGQLARPVSDQFRLDYEQPMPRQTNALAIAALCCGIGQLIAGPLTGIPAVVLGAISLRQIRQTGEDGRGLAITGLVLGAAGTFVFALIIIFVAYIAHAVLSQS
jgi:Domain of unknown function (DUF4190)